MPQKATENFADMKEEEVDDAGYLIAALKRRKVKLKQADIELRNQIAELQQETLEMRRIQPEPGLLQLLLLRRRRRHTNRNQDCHLRFNQDGKIQKWYDVNCWHATTNYNSWKVE